eukprot:GHVP01064097.1.p1 GENE.GHVP01064097.1~~GHVP01064097.1.p1  ORF type:complete len:144 (-),score=14.78 GHVP01064097.1:293-724(-)
MNDPSAAFFEDKKKLSDKEKLGLAEFVPRALQLKVAFTNAKFVSKRLYSGTLSDTVMDLLLLDIKGHTILRTISSTPVVLFSNGSPDDHKTNKIPLDTRYYHTTIPHSFDTSNILHKFHQTTKIPTPSLPFMCSLYSARNGLP